jgi:hypothetical protein
LLGSAESSIPEDVKWARDLTEALSSGGEQEIRSAKDIDSSLSELAGLFPAGGADVVRASESATIREAFNSENIQEHLPALRGAVRSTLERVRSRYSERRAIYAKALQSILQEFEAGADWARLEPDDREELAKKLAPQGLPETPAAGREIADLRFLLARQANIQALQAEVATEIQQRLPIPPAPPEPSEPPTEEIVDWNDLAIPEVIKTSDDLEGWLSGLRARFGELLRTNKTVRIKKRL